MFVVEGQKLKGNSFKWTYKDAEENVARFEYDVTKIVSSYIVLAHEENGLYEQLDIYVRGQ